MTTDKDFLWLNLRDLPYFRAMLRAVEAQFYQQFELPAPTLDLGCGDGHFASITFDRKLEVGLDPWAGPIHQAARKRWLSITGAGRWREECLSRMGTLPAPSATQSWSISPRCRQYWLSSGGC